MSITRLEITFNRNESNFEDAGNFAEKLMNNSFIKETSIIKSEMRQKSHSISYITNITIKECEDFSTKG